jgi:hypothetical protein
MEIAPVPGIRAVTPTGARPTLEELPAPAIVEAAGRMEDDSYAGSGEGGDRAYEENLARRLEQELMASPTKGRARRGVNAGYGEPYHQVDLFV